MTMTSSSPSFDIQDKIVLVTGANRGIGKALVEGFLGKGAAKVYAGVRILSNANDLVQKYGSNRVVPIHMDLSDPSSIHQAAEISYNVDLVVNNAGVLELVDPLDKDFLKGLQHQLEVNLYGLVHIAQAFCPILEKKQSGAFVQINSTSSLRCPGSKFAGYAASKAAAFGFLQGLRNSLTNTLIVSVHPGPIATDMVDQFAGRGRSEPPSQVADAVIDALKEGHFLVYTDTFSRSIGEAYQQFADTVIEPTSKPQKGEAKD
jgi:NAD(P)-dependent dehydrogenase (short-subunit alcohol dehydrogenase family)